MKNVCDCIMCAATVQVQIIYSFNDARVLLRLMAQMRSKCYSTCRTAFEFQLFPEYFHISE